MADALTGPFLIAALVLCVAGAAKLRSPAAARRALAVIGLAAPAGLVRAFAAGELALGLWCTIDPGRLAAGMMGCLYALFAGVGLLLARQRASCGCFGEGEHPASIAQAILSAGLALLALAALLSLPHGFGWVLERPPIDLAVLICGTAGAVYGTVIAYTEMPLAWGSWSER